MKIRYTSLIAIAAALFIIGVMESLRLGQTHDTLEAIRASYFIFMASLALLFWALLIKRRDRERQQREEQALKKKEQEKEQPKPKKKVKP